MSCWYLYSDNPMILNLKSISKLVNSSEFLHFETMFKPWHQSPGYHANQILKYFSK